MQKGEETIVSLREFRTFAINCANHSQLSKMSFLTSVSTLCNVTYRKLEVLGLFFLATPLIQ